LLRRSEGWGSKTSWFYYDEQASHNSVQYPGGAAASSAIRGASVDGRGYLPADLGAEEVIRKLLSHIPPGQFFRYLLVGIWNTGFGYGTFVLFTYLLSRRWPQYGYIPGSILSSLVSITVAFLGYKWFVFKTQGNYWREWLRCVAVYGSNIAIGTVLLPCVVYAIRHATAIDGKAPYVAAALMMGFNTIYNFLGHRKFSFRVQQPPV
jgi:putative flippase GtrA